MSEKAASKTFALPFYGREEEEEREMDGDKEK